MMNVKKKSDNPQLNVIINKVFLLNIHKITENANELL